MFYFDLYGRLAFLFALLFCVGLILLAVVIYYSVGNYEKPKKADGTPDEHAEPGVPLVLKGTFDILPRHAYYLQERRPIHFEICPPVDPADYPDDRACIAEVERRVHEVWERG